MQVGVGEKSGGGRTVGLGRKSGWRWVRREMCSSDVPSGGNERSEAMPCEGRRSKEGRSEGGLEWEEKKKKQGNGRKKKDQKEKKRKKNPRQMHET